MRNISYVISIYLYLITNSTFCQTWMRSYGGNTPNLIHQLYEHYDKGYILSGEQGDGYTDYGWIVKTDVNGFQKWSKSYGSINKTVIFYGSKPTNNGGLINIGVTNNLNSSCTDPLIVKLNACGEKEWCKMYNAPNCNCGGLDIVMTPDGGYFALIDHWSNSQQKLIWLFRLDCLGDIIWSQAYATDSVFVGESSHTLLCTNDTSLIITAETYYPDATLPPNNYILKILLIKVKFNGNAQFTVPWGTNNGIISDGRNSSIDNKNNIYTVGRRARTVSPGGDSPCIFRTRSNSQPISFTDLKTTSTVGNATTVNWFQDSTMVCCAGWQSQLADTTALIKITSGGSIIGQKEISNINETMLYASTITYNNRILVGGGIVNPVIQNWQSFAFKLTSNLDYDSIYTTPFTYDSLCPHPIVSDTIPLDDCQVVIVGLDDAEKNPEKAKLHIYPNPAGGDVTIELPQYLVRRNKGSGITATTTYFKWNQTRLDILDLTGKLLFSQDIPKQQTLVKLNVSAWPAGMYLARLVFMNEVVAEAKFVK